MKKLAIISTIVLGLGFVSCDSHLDVNQNPNSPAESNMTPSIMMPAAEMNFAATYGSLMRIPAGYFAQHYAQLFGTSNYVDYSQFQMSATRSNTAYSQMMRGALKNLETIRNISKETEPGSYLAATVMRAFAFQSLVDCYGEVPFSEAFDVSNPSPHYDEGASIYSALIAEINEALANVSPTDRVATNFLFQTSTAAPWIKFANAVKLKILSRESGVASVDSEIGALIAEGNFPTSDVAYAGIWENEQGKLNPFYAEEIYQNYSGHQDNVVANIALVGTMILKDSEGTIKYEDPRLGAFFDKNSSGNYTGGISGTNFSTSKTYKATYWCRPVGSYDMPLYLLTQAEIEFFISEYYARIGNAGEAEAHYNAAIEASFATAGVEGAEENIAQWPYDQSNYKKCIGIAKWLALSGVNNYESWCELRRLRYPAFGTVKGIDMYNLQDDASYKPELYQPGTLYTPIQVFGNVGDNHLLERYPYPSSSTASNSNAPTFSNSDYIKPVFWAN